MKTFFKAPEGIYKLDFELKKLEKTTNTTVVPKTFRLFQHSVQVSKVEKFLFFFKFQGKKKLNF
jgi:hypothetical protein